jgi:hypothetical protein
MAGLGTGTEKCVKGQEELVEDQTGKYWDKMIPLRETLILKEVVVKCSLRGVEVTPVGGAVHEVEVGQDGMKWRVQQGFHGQLRRKPH